MARETCKPSFADGLLHAGNLKPFGFEQRANLAGLVALNFDLVTFHSAAAAIGLLELGGERFDLGVRDLRGKIVDDDHSFASAMCGLAAEHDATALRWRYRQFRPCRQAFAG